MIEQYINIEKKVETPEIRKVNRRPPIKPVSFEIRLEGQRKDETYEEALNRVRKEQKRFALALTVGLILICAGMCVALIHAILSVV